MTDKNKKLDFKAAAAVFLFFWALYLWTLSPSILFEDSGEFMLSTATLGVSHPPGYPLYNLTGHILHLLPAGDAAFRANMASAFMGALAVCTLFAAARGFGFSFFAALAGAMACGLSRTIWSQAVIDEVYMLNMLLNAGMLLALSQVVKGSRRWAVGAIALVGLSATNHYMTPAAFSPVILLLLIFSGFGFRKIVSIVTAGAAVLASFSIFYAYVPLRAAAQPVLNWMNPSTFERFVDHITRAQFGHFENQIKFHIPTVMKFLSHFFENITTEFFVVFLFLALLGASVFLVERWKQFAIFIWLFLVQSAGVLFYVRFHANETGFSIVRVFYIGSYLVVGLLVAAGMDTLISQVSKAVGKKVGAAAGIGLLVLLVFPLVSNYRAVDMSHETRTTEFGRDILRYLPRDTVLYIQGSQFTSPAMYFKYVDNTRPDITLIAAGGNLMRSEIEKIRGDFDYINMDIVLDSVMDYYHGRRPQAMTYPRLSSGLEAAIQLRGPFFYRAQENGCDLEGWDPGKYNLDPQSLKNMDFEIRMLPSILEARLAECSFLNNDHPTALKHLMNAVDALPDSAHVQMYAGQLVERYGLESVSLKYYEKALELCPTFTDALIARGQRELEKQAKLTSNQRSFVTAESFFNRALEVNPKHLQARLSLANIAKIHNDSAKAEQLYLDLLKDYPESVIVYVNLGNLYVEQRKRGEAAEMFDKALELDRESTFVIVNAASFYLASGRFPTAMELLEKFLESNPDSAYGHYNYALALQGAGDYNNAIVHYRKAVELAPKLVHGWQNLVLTVFMKQGAGPAFDEYLKMLDIEGEPVQKAADGLLMRMISDSLGRGSFDEMRIKLLEYVTGDAESADRRETILVKTILILMQLNGSLHADSLLEWMENSGDPDLVESAGQLRERIEEVRNAQDGGVLPDAGL